MKAFLINRPCTVILEGEGMTTRVLMPGERVRLRERLGTLADVELTDGTTALVDFANLTPEP